MTASGGSWGRSMRLVRGVKGLGSAACARSSGVRPEIAAAAAPAPKRRTKLRRETEGLQDPVLIVTPLKSGLGNRYTTACDKAFTDAQLRTLRFTAKTWIRNSGKNVECCVHSITKIHRNITGR